MLDSCIDNHSVKSYLSKHFLFVAITNMLNVVITGFLSPGTSHLEPVVHPTN